MISQFVCVLLRRVCAVASLSDQMHHFHPLDQKTGEKDLTNAR